MKCLESLIVAFSMYSKIPVPQIEWKKDNMRFALCYFPLVGAVTGLIVWLWSLISGYLGVGTVLSTAVFVLIPVAVSGGIHLDGLLDTADALSSWQTRERRLEILKDSHAGAFAIICCAVYFILYAGAVSLIESRTFFVLAFMYVMIRSGSGMSIVTLKLAKNTGLAATFSDGASKRVIRVWMFVYMIVCVTAMCWMNGILGLLCTAVFCVVWIYFRHMVYDKFGGVNGDMAGWFLQVCELGVMIAAAILTLGSGGTLWS